MIKFPIFFLIVFFCFVSSNAEELTLQSIKSKLSENRERLSSKYYVKLVIDKSSNEKSSSNHLKSEVQIWSNDKTVRIDRKFTDGSGKNIRIGQRDIACQNCPLSGYLMTTSTGGKDLALIQFWLPNEAGEGLWSINWKGLGLFNKEFGQLFEQSSTDFVSAILDHPDTKIKISKRDGFECIVLTWVPQNNPSAEFNCWLREDLGMNPVYMETKNSKGRFQVDTTIQIKKYGEVFYPSKISYRYENGSTLYSEEVEVVEARFQTVNPEDVFKLSSMSLEEGQAIGYPDIKKTSEFPTWKNGKEDKEYTLGIATQKFYESRPELLKGPAAIQKPKESSPLFLVIGVACLIGLIFAVYKLRTKPKVKSVDFR
jgi:hypothetical protein